MGKRRLVEATQERFPHPGAAINAGQFEEQHVSVLWPKPSDVILDRICHGRTVWCAFRVGICQDTVVCQSKGWPRVLVLTEAIAHGIGDALVVREGGGMQHAK